MPQADFAPLQMNPLGEQLDLSNPAGARLPNLALPVLAGMGIQAGAQALADFGAGISGSPTLGEQNVAARGTAAELAGLGMGVPAPPGSLSAFLGYHGTPHLFPAEPGAPFGAFRNEAIGSGEGAQAYGWGHYVAGNPSVAEGYRNQLSGGGHLLEVHILPEESDLLDWDKSLSEQPTGVQEALKPISSSLPDQGQGWTGQMIYQNLVRQYGDKLSANLGGTTARELGPRAASQALDAAGIPGLRYMDAGSRYSMVPVSGGIKPVSTFDSGPTFPTREEAMDWADKNASRNYVLFHPRHLRIIGRNGERLEPVEHDPFAGAEGQ